MLVLLLQPALMNSPGFRSQATLASDCATQASYAGASQMFLKLTCPSTTTNLTTEVSNEQTAKPCTTINCCVQRPIDEPADSDRWAGRSPSEGSFVGTYCYQRVNDGTGQGGLVTVDFAPFDQAAQPPPPSPAELAQQAIDQILVPPPHIGAGPDRTKLAVNLWTWLWIDAEAPLLRQSHPVVFQ